MKKTEDLLQEKMKIQKRTKEVLCPFCTGYPRHIIYVTNASTVFSSNDFLATVIAIWTYVSSQ